MNHEYIEEGDYVDVYFEFVEAEHHLRVLYSPQQTGDSWHLKRDNGTLVYIQFFSKMVKCEKEIEPPF